MRHQLSRLLLGVIIIGCLIAGFSRLQGEVVNQSTQVISSNLLARQASECLFVNSAPAAQSVFPNSSLEGAVIKRKGDNQKVTVSGRVERTRRPKKNGAVEIFIPQTGNGIPKTGWIWTGNPPWKTVPCS